MAKMSIDQALQLAYEHLRMGRRAHAETIAQAVLQSEPAHPGALHVLAQSAFQNQEFGTVESLLGQALTATPTSIPCLALLAGLRNRQGRINEGAQIAHRLLTANPGLPDAEVHLADALMAAGRIGEAEMLLRNLLNRLPQHAQAWNSLGCLLQNQARVHEAEGAYRNAVISAPGYSEAFGNLAVSLQSQSRWQEAESAYRDALAINPRFADAESNLASLLHFLGRVDEAEAACHRALAVRPDFANAYTNLGASVHSQGRVEDAHAAYWQASRYNPTSSMMHSYALFSEQYLPDVTPQRLLEVHCAWDDRHGKPLQAQWQPHANSPQPDRALRLGFVSPDLSRHPVGTFLIRIFENLDPRDCQIVCYSDRFVKDEMSNRIARAAQLWRDIRGLTDRALWEQVRQDQIDVLFDLAGHGLNNRLSVFAMKPAPLQATWLGYEGTSGLSAIDYIVADRYQIPEGHECYYREKPLILAGGYVCYDPLEEAPPVAPLPASRRGYLTFGSFNNLAKITPQVIAVWARIMKALPNSRLVLKYKGLETVPIRRRYADLFAAEGIDPARLDMLGWTTYAHALSMYHGVDIALDTFPFSGSLTTCDAMWMGVPVVTWPGPTFGGRHTLGHLQRIGRPEWIARDLEHYVEIVLQLAQDLPQLAEIRAGLRQCVAQSPLCDGRSVAQDLSRALRAAWREWCAARK